MPARTLVLLRHAKSDWDTHETDVRRPLAKRGRRQAPEAGRWLAEHVGEIDLAVVSPAERARTTWDLAAAELPSSPETREDDRVYAASGPELLDVVRDLPADRHTVVLVGHNPGMEELVQLMAGDWVAMPTSALAVLDVPVAWAEAGDQRATLRAAGRPPS